ncbi:MAG: hypothetical protein WCJ75_09890 [Desulfomonile sp.]
MFPPLVNRPANGKSSASRKYSTAFSRGFRLDTLRTSAGFQVLKGLGEILANYGISDFETGITKEFPAEMKVDLYFIRGMGAIENRPAVTVRLIGTCEATDTVGDDEGTTPPIRITYLFYCLLYQISFGGSEIYRESAISRHAPLHADRGITGSHLHLPVM